MKLADLLMLTTAASLLSCSWAHAQVAENSGSDGGDQSLDLTMTLLPEGATLPDAVTRVIELPEAASDRARDSANPGLESADNARERRDTGLEIAADAIEGGREFGQAMREQAQESRENAGRADPPDRPELPDHVPDSPGPANPGGRPGN